MMNQDRFRFVCNEAEQGRDAFVSHAKSDEQGRVTSCAMTQVMVETSSGAQRCWDYSEVREMEREKDAFPYR